VHFNGGKKAEKEGDIGFVESTNHFQKRKTFSKCHFTKVAKS